jgi:diketogulonate reductase-like aldo/keto reductase
LLKIWKAMESIHRAGGARQLGISNCYDPHLMRMLHADAAVKPTVVQNRFYAQSGYDADLRHWCSGHGVVYQSFWTLTANPHILASPTVRSLAQQYGKTQAQIFFRYLTQAEIVPLTGTTSERHMHEDLSIFDFELSSAELGQMEVLLKP